MRFAFHRMTSDITPAAVLDLIVEQQIVDTHQPMDIHSDLFALGLDSMAMMQLLLHIEDHFGVAVQPGEMTRERFATATSLGTFLAQKRSAQSN